MYIKTFLTDKDRIVPFFNLIEKGLRDISLDGEFQTVEFDTTEFKAAAMKGAVIVKISVFNIEHEVCMNSIIREDGAIQLSGVVSVIYDDGTITPYSATIAIDDEQIIVCCKGLEAGTAVLFTEQSLSLSEKEQAKENLGINIDLMIYYDKQPWGIRWYLEPSMNFSQLYSLIQQQKIQTCRLIQDNKEYLTTQIELDQADIIFYTNIGIFDYNEHGTFSRVSAPQIDALIINDSLHLNSQEGKGIFINAYKQDSKMTLEFWEAENEDSVMLKRIADPIEGEDAANKQYVDNKPSVQIIRVEEDDS